MEEPKKNEIVNNIQGQTIEPDIYARHWFCAALLASGATYRKDAESPAVFKDILKDAVIAWVDCWTDNFEKNALDAAIQLGFSKELVVPLITEEHENYVDLGKELGIKMASVQVKQFDVTIHPLILLLSKNFILTIHPRTVDRRFQRLRRYADTFLKKIPLAAVTEDRLTMLLLRLTDETNERNFEHLRQIEDYSDELNKDMMDPATPRETLGPKIYEMKHALVIYLNALWQTVDVFHALRYGDAELITDNVRLLARMNLQAEDVNHQISLSEHMSDVMASGLEVLQTIYNNQLQALNNRLSRVITYLTIIGTALLVPNTLATVFSSSAFNLQPDDMWWYATMLAAATIFSTWLVWLWVRKLGWTHKMDTSVKDFGIEAEPVTRKRASRKKIKTKKQQ
ncbi:MAG: CorA family divalent cation transporter [Dehalococcoidia bacterium]|jgi:magnesium transporter